MFRASLQQQMILVQVKQLYNASEIGGSHCGDRKDHILLECNDARPARCVPSLQRI